MNTTGNKPEDSKDGKSGPNVLSDIGCFRDLSPGDLDFLSDRKTQLVYTEGENIFKQGAFAPYVMLIISGLVKVYLQTGPGRQINIRLARTGDFLAFQSVFGVNVYNYSSIALKESKVCMISTEGLRELLLRNPSFALEVTSRNYRNEILHLEIIKNLSYKQMRGKLASSLMYLSSPEFSDEEVFQHLSRQDIADFASIAPESTVRFLKEFEKEGIIRLEGRDIEVLDRDLLGDISRRG
jgi:CRP-like cAMP-binding protein